MMVKSRNIGGRNSLGEFLLFVDDDNELHPEMISKLIEHMEFNPKTAIVGPQMAYADSKKIYLSYQRINLWTGKTTGYIARGDPQSFPCDGIPNVFMVRSSVFSKVGLFDEDIVQTFTEPDLAYAIKKSGYRCETVSDAITFHRIPEDGGAERWGGRKYNQKAFFLMRNRTVIVCRYGSLLQSLSYLLIFSWIWPLIYSLIVIRHNRWDLVRLYWLGFVEGWRFIFRGNKLAPADQTISKLKALGV